MSETVKGLKKLISTLEKLPAELENDIHAIVGENAREIEEEAKRRAPVGTPESTGIKGYIGGSLKQSIKRLSVGKLVFKIITNSTGHAPYAIYVEYGTRKMKKQPFLFPAFFAQRPKFIEDLEALLKSKFNKV